MPLSKMRVYELAKLLEMNNKDLLTLLEKVNVSVKSHMSTIDDDAIQLVEEEIEKSKKKKSPSGKSVPAKAEPEKKAPAPKAEKAESKTPAPAEEKKAPAPAKETVKVKHGGCVKDLADALGLSAAEAVKKLMSAGMMVPASASLNDDILLTLGDVCGVDVDWSDEEPAKEAKKAPAPQPAGGKATPHGSHLKPRSPIVTVMGHVDHGKTSLLDAIRKTHVTAREAGGITQHIGASHVAYNGKEIVFLDTPGHEAFTSMRARGAQCTDIAVLVVAADDGVMPQTIEAINHAKAAGVPIIVAINKMDKPTANPQQVMQELSGYGLVSEAWGGDTVMVEISAKSGKGVDQLLEMISLVAEMQDLKADPTVPPEGVVIEARLDKGQGAVASVIVQQGTLCRGDLILFDTCWGKVRAMFNDAGKNVKQAGPSTAVEIIGLNGVPQPGEHFHQIGSEKEARDYFANLEAERRNAQNNMAVKRMTLEDLYSQVQDGEKPVLNLVIKCDVQGTIEAIVGSLEKLGTEDVGINIVHTAVGRISESDIMLATASNAIVVGFNVRPENSASKLAEKENVQIRLYSIIYEIIDDVKAAMEGLLTPTIKENSLGEVEIRKIFKAPKVGKIAGCRVMKGAIKRGSKVRLVRDGIVIWEGSVASLRREKDEASEVREGFECGMTFANYQDFREGDVVEAYELVEEKRTL
ncbi:translation initiation factor IF-2 [Pyramidobacter sp. C12-8]|uniref:translation initiation factor IF-2 n=1 Tax=Pyramidobacter sp. C12-8 TaxID=1943580 RepID=UPI0009C5F5C3|nr:translation initiation factor IF-2 [Pyramidobacter sp. C12-8]OON88532.1 translation initiation factor IF-2 [Pyramidobacter sp. C12-8]